MLLQGYGDHKPKSSTAAQEVKTLDGIFTEQVSEDRCQREAEGAGSRKCADAHLTWLDSGLSLPPVLEFSDG